MKVKELCRDPVANATPQALRMKIIAQNATTAAIGISKENLYLIFSPPLKRRSSKLKGDFRPKTKL